MQKTNNFMLAVATVMIGPRADLMKLTPEEHGIGIVKNYTVTNDKSSTDLNSGIQNDLAYTMVTSSDTRSTMEVYEYTAKNMSYALGLAGYDVVEVEGNAYVTAAVGTNNTDKTHTVSVNVDAEGQTFNIGDAISVRFPENDNIVLGSVTDPTDLATGGLTIKVDIGDVVIPAGSVIQRMTVLELGSSEEQAEFATKVQGQLADGTWVVVLNPRVRMTSSFSAAFSSENYGNLPFEWRNLKLLPGDDFYADFRGMSGKLGKDAVRSART